MFVWVTERTLKNIDRKKAVNRLWLVHNIIHIIKKKKIIQTQTKKIFWCIPKLLQSFRPAFGFDLIPASHVN